MVDEDYMGDYFGTEREGIDFEGDRQRAIAWAKAMIAESPVYLDTETTGLGPRAQICDLAVLDCDGSILMNTLIKPTVSIPKDVEAIHGISDSMVKHAPTFAQVRENLERILNGRRLIIYNANYDIPVLLESARANNTVLFGGIAGSCAMLKYAEFHGEWNDYRGSYKWQKLEKAARQCGLVIPKDLHRARADADLTRQVVWYMSEAK